MPLIATAGTASAEPYGYAIAPPRERLFPVSSLLVIGNGANGANNSTFLDSSTANSGSGWTVNAIGNVAQGSLSPFARPPLNWSYYIYNTASLTFPAGLVTAMGTSGLAGKRFTMESFIFPNTITTNNNGYTPIFGSINGTASNGRWWFGFRAITSTAFQVAFMYSTGTATEVVATATTTNGVYGQWNHIAVTIDAITAASTTINFFANGLLVGTSTGNNLSTQTTYLSTPFIGSGLAVTPTSNIFTGYLSNFRVTYNLILYTGDYTVPTSPLTTSPVTPSSGTALLTAQNNYMKDNSPNNFSVSNSGSFFAAPSVISPFTYNYPYSSTLAGGGMFFQGGGGYLSIPDNAALEMGTSDFCFECLFNAGNLTSTGTIVQKRNGTGVSPIIIWRFGANIQVYLANVTQGSIVNGTSLGTISPNQWYHVAVYRVGTAIYGSLNGVITTLNANTSLSILNNAEPYTIGVNGNGSSDPFYGRMSNVRLVIGSSVYTSTSVPRPTEPLRNITDTKLLLLGGNASVVDSTANFNMELIDTSVSTAQSKYGVGVLSFNGTSSYIRLLPFYNNFSPLVIPVGNVTAEVFVYPTSFAANQTVLFLTGFSSAASIILSINVTTGVPVAAIYTDGGVFGASLTSSTALTLNAWSHLAVVRNGGTFTLYLNGTSVASSTAISATTALLSYLTSSLGAASPAASFYSGYMYGVRVSYGARYTANFTPPTGPYPLLGP